MKKNQKGNKSVIFICDAISYFNIQGFDNCSERKAIKKAKELGDRIYKVFEDCVNDLVANDYVKICRWNEDENIASEKLIESLKTNEFLNERVEIIAKNFLTYRGQGKLNKSYEKKLELAKNYIFSEIPVLVLGIVIDGVHYKLLHYSGSQLHLSNFVNNKNSLHCLINDIYDNKEILNMIISDSKIKCAKISGFIGIEF